MFFSQVGATARAGHSIALLPGPLVRIALAVGECSSRNWASGVKTRRQQGLRFRRPLRTWTRLVAEISPLGVDKLDLRAGYLNERSATGAEAQRAEIRAARTTSSSTSGNSRDGRGLLTSVPFHGFIERNHSLF
jgi:hypothetical protein